MARDSGVSYQITQISALVDPGGFAAEKLMLQPFIEEGTAVAFGRALSTARDRSLNPGETFPFDDDRLSQCLNAANCFITMNLVTGHERARILIFTDGEWGITARIGPAGWLTVNVWDDTPQLDENAIRNANSGVVEASFRSGRIGIGYGWASGGRSAHLRASEWVHSNSADDDHFEGTSRLINSASKPWPLDVDNPAAP